MTHIERRFCIDLLRALDKGIGETLRTDEEYDDDLNTVTKKEVLKTVRYLTELGYRLDKTQ